MTAPIHLTPLGITALILSCAYARIADRKIGRIGAGANLELEIAKSVEQLTGFSQDEFFTEVVNFETALAGK